MLNDEKELDIIIFGATGNIGKKILAYFLFKQFSCYSIGLAGRSSDKLEQLINGFEYGIPELYVNTAMASLKNISLITADTEDEESITSMVQRTKILINCVGPYNLYGEPVVSACAQYGTHYLDVSGETYFNELMMEKYNELAKSNETIIINGCGFNSVIADVGTAYTISQYKGDKCVHNVKSFVQLNYPYKMFNSLYCSFTAYKSGIEGLSRYNKVMTLRKISQMKLPRIGSKLKTKQYIPYLEENLYNFKLYNYTAKKYCITSPFSDSSVVKKTQELNYRKRELECTLNILQGLSEEENEKKIQLINQKHPVPIQYRNFLVTKNWFYMLLLMFFGIIFTTLVCFKKGRSFLEKAYAILSFGTVSKKSINVNINNYSTFRMIFKSQGYTDYKLPTVYLSNKKTTTVENLNSLNINHNNNKNNNENENNDKPNYEIITSVNGPEIHKSASICIYCAAMTILEDDLLSNFGVLTPSIALSCYENDNPSFITRLQNNGITFSVISTKDI